MTTFRRNAANIFFIVSTIASGWIAAWIIHYHEWQLGWHPSGEALLIISLSGLGPGLAAICALALGNGNLKNELGIQRGKLFYILPAWLLLPVLALLCAALSVMFGWAEWDWNISNAYHDLLIRWPEHGYIQLKPAPHGLIFFTSNLFLGPIIWFLFAWIEELGWRGYAYHRFKPKGFLFTVIVTALIWWIWKAPFYYLGYTYPGHPIFGLFLSLVFGIEISFLLTWLRAASQNTIIPAIAKATLYSSALTPLSFTQNYDPVFAHLQGLTGIIVLGIFIVLICLSIKFHTPAINTQ